MKKSKQKAVYLKQFKKTIYKSYFKKRKFVYSTLTHLPNATLFHTIKKSKIKILFIPTVVINIIVSCYLFSHFVALVSSKSNTTNFNSHNLIHDIGFIILGS